MLELYHHGSSVCAAKVRMYMHEKDLDWEGHYIDILKGEQFDPAYMKLNPKAVVPTLVHDGEVICDSTVICEYLEDVFTDIALRPTNGLEHARVLYWTKAGPLGELHIISVKLCRKVNNRTTIRSMLPFSALQAYLF